MLVVRPIRSSAEARRMVAEYMSRSYFNATGFKWGSSIYHKADDGPDTKFGPMCGFIIVGDPLNYQHNDGRTVQILRCFANTDEVLRPIGLNREQVTSILVAKATEAASYIGFDRLLGYCIINKDDSLACRHFYRFV